MKTVLKKYLNLIIVSLTILLLPLNWYFCLEMDSETFEVYEQTQKGWQVMLNGWGLVLVIFLLCIFTQYIACKKRKMYRIFAIFSQVIFVWIITVVFFMTLKRESVAITMMLKAKMIGFREGYFLCVGIMLISVVLNIIGFVKAKNKKNDA